MLETAMAKTSLTGEYGEICRTSRVRLDVDSPKLWVESERLQRTLATELLDLVDVDGASIITGSRISLGVLVV